MTESKPPYVVVAGVDFSSTGDLAFERAVELCQAQPDATLHAVNVAFMVLGASDLEQALLPDPRLRVSQVEDRLRAYLEARTKPRRERGESLPRIVAHVRWEVPGEEIAQLAADLEADLVVVGTHGRRGFSRVMLGSVAEAVVRLAPCPVLVVRPKGPANVPAIEPPCPECVKARVASKGQSYWCEQHSQRHGQRHTYYSRDRISEDGTLPLVFHG